MRGGNSVGELDKLFYGNRGAKFRESCVNRQNVRYDPNPSHAPGLSSQFSTPNRHARSKRLKIKIAFGCNFWRSCLSVCDS